MVLIICQIKCTTNLRGWVAVAESPYKKNDQSSPAARMHIFRSVSKNSRDSLFSKEGHLFAKEGHLFAKQEHLFAKEGHLFAKQEHLFA